jgi:hypothetical protein
MIFLSTPLAEPVEATDISCETRFHSSIKAGPIALLFFVPKLVFLVSKK